MIAADLATVIMTAVTGHPDIVDIRRVPTGIADRAALHIADSDFVLWTVAVAPQVQP